MHNHSGKSGKVRLMFQDEAGFGRINKPKYCWCRKGIRPSVPCHHIREYRYAYGAVEPLTGESCFLVMPYCNTVCMDLFLNQLSGSASPAKKSRSLRVNRTLRTARLRAGWNSANPRNYKAVSRGERQLPSGSAGRELR